MPGFLNQAFFLTTDIIFFGGILSANDQISIIKNKFVSLL